METKRRTVIRNKPSKSRVSKKLKIFISHKHKDEAAANVIVNKLRPYSSEKVDFFVSEEIPKGTEWAKKIHTSLKETNWLILLYTDPSAEWDWCLYETGFYMGSIEKKKRRLVCLHSPDVDPPSPITPWQNVKANKKEVVKLLKDIYFRINKEFANSPDELESVAEVIVNAVGPKPKYQPYNKFFFLSFDYDSFKKINDTGKIPGEVAISSEEIVGKPLSMFGLSHKECKWADIVKQLNNRSENNWARNLGYIIRAINQGRNINTALPLFQSSTERKIYRPVLHRRTWINNREYTYKLIFIEVPTEEDVKPVGDVGMTCTLLNVARKFQTTVIDKYLREIDRFAIRPPSDIDISCLLENLDIALWKLEGEADTGGFNDIEAILLSFRNEESRDKFKEMIQYWRELRVKLAKHIDDKDIDGVKDILIRIRGMVKEFLVLSINNYLVLLEEM